MIIRFYDLEKADDLKKRMIFFLDLENFRNFEALNLTFDAPSVIFTGANGQGKTSVLEAIFFLANLRSFRTVKIREMQKLGTDFFHLACTLACEKWNTRLEFENTVPRRLKVDGIPISRSSDFTGRMQTIAFLPNDSDIIGGTSLLRRRFFDMFISMLDKSYFAALQQYSAALKERNFMLRAPSCNMDVLRSYHPILAENGCLIMKKRLDYMNLLMESMRSIFHEIRPEFHSFSIRMRFAKDVDSVQSYMEKLDSHYEYDKLHGFTAIGPHMDDFDFIVNDKSLRIYGSNGQKRIASFALKMAEFDIVGSKEESRKNTIVIVDDATGDLDYRTKSAFFEKIQTAGQ